MTKRIITEIWIYPVKSMGGIPLDQATVMAKGLEYDRRWMLIDAQHKSMTQRIYPLMALFKLSIIKDGINITFNDETKVLPFASTGPTFPAMIWNDEVDVIEVQKEISEWVSGILGVECKLVYFPENNLRAVEQPYAKNNEQVSLADAYPLLIIGQASLDDLNNRLKDPLPMNRFRPNIVFTGGEPYEEDGWGEFHINQLTLEGVKPCARCTVPTVNQETAEKGAEPLVTFGKYRKKGNNVYFGQNLLVRSEGEIKKGEEIILV